MDWDEASWSRDRFVDMSDKTFDILKCPICHNMVRDPVMCSNQHHMCKACYQQMCKAMSDAPTCPECRTPIAESTTSRTVRTLVDSCIIRCRYHRNGCLFKTSLDTIDRHEHRCAYRIDNCPYHPCEFRGDPSQVMDHIKTCLNRHGQCPDCGAYCYHNAQSQHNCTRSLAGIVHRQAVEIREMRQQIRLAHDHFRKTHRITCTKKIDGRLLKRGHGERLEIVRSRVPECVSKTLDIGNGDILAIMIGSKRPIYVKSTHTYTYLSASTDVSYTIRCDNGTGLTFSMVHEFRPSESPPPLQFDIAYHGKVIVTITGDGVVNGWDATTGIHMWGGDINQDTQIASNWTLISRNIATHMVIRHDDMYYLCDVLTGRCVHKLDNIHSLQHSVRHTNDGEYFTARSASHLWVYKTDSPTPCVSLDHSVDMAVTGTRRAIVVTASFDGVITLLDMKTREMSHFNSMVAVKGIALTRNNDMVVAVHADDTTRVWSLNPLGQEVDRMYAGANSIGFNDRGTVMMGLCDDGDVRIWERSDSSIPI